MEKIYVVTDLGPGDGGKGSIVHSLVHKINPDIIIKRGGAQGSHGVCTAAGEKFNFSQWGCGTMEGVPTFLSRQMVISPIGLGNEATALKRCGIYDPFTLLSADPSCIVATPFHKIASELEELLLKDNPRGTVGTGVGQAYRMCKNLGAEMTIRASELQDREIIARKLQKQLNYYRLKYRLVTEDDVLPSDAELTKRNLRLLYDSGYLPYILDYFENIGKKLRFRSLDEVISGDGSAIVECSHGVLTDAEAGLKPHVSAIRTLPRFANEMLMNAGYDGKIINLAVHRAYEIRHGAGPMPTYDKEFTAQMLPGSHKANNRWQGEVRAGPLDTCLLRYALLSEWPAKFNGLCLTSFDQILATGRMWSICTDYQNTRIPYENVTDYLKRAEPKIRKYPIRPHISRRDLFELVKEILNVFIEVPLEILGVGPTERDKIYSKSFLKGG